MKRIFAYVFASFMLVCGSAQAAVVVMTDGMLAVYDPSNVYVPAGVIGGSEIFSIGLVYADPGYSNVINLTAPDDLAGSLEWAFTRGVDATGLLFSDGALSSGESTSLIMGGFPTASVNRPLTMWFSMAAFDSAPLAFGPEIPGGIIGFPAPVPEASTWAMLLIGLGLVGLMTNRRQKQNPKPLSL